MSHEQHHHEVLKDQSPQHRSLRKQIPDVYKGFAELSTAALTDGALSRGVKELIALAIGVVEGCDGCIASHAKAAARAGATAGRSRRGRRRHLPHAWWTGHHLRRAGLTRRSANSPASRRPRPSGAAQAVVGGVTPARCGGTFSRVTACARWPVASGGRIRGGAGPAEPGCSATSRRSLTTTRRSRSSTSTRCGPTPGRC